MSLTVLYNGKRKKLKATPGTVMNQILQSAVNAFQAPSPAAGFDLKHASKAIDLSLPFRLTGISNNGTVEMVPRKLAESSQSVRICVQMEGTRGRVQGTVSSDKTVAEFLSQLQVPYSSQTSLVYMRKEILPSEFDNTRLKDLGISGGSALFRLKEASAGTNPEPIPVQNRTTPVTSQDIKRSEEILKPKTASFTSPPAVPMEVGQIEEETKQEVVARCSSNSNQTPHVSSGVALPTCSPEEALETMRSSVFDQDAKETVLMLMRIIANILSDPEEEKFRSLRLSNAKLQRTVAKVKGGFDFLFACGFRMDESNPTLNRIILPRLSPLSESTLRSAFRALERHIAELEPDRSVWPVVKVPLRGDESIPFDPFKSQVFRSRDHASVKAPTGPSAAERELNALKKKCENIEAQDSDLPARMLQVVFPAEQDVTVSADIGTEVEAPSAEERKLIVQEIQRRRQEMEKRSKFSTKTMRELETLKNKRVFRHTALKIQFPDRVVVHMRFLPKEKLETVLSVLREEVLNESHTAEGAFYLFVSPPVHHFSKKDENKTLQELGLVPAAVLHLGWKEATSLPKPPTGHYLQEKHVNRMEEKAGGKHAVALGSALYPKSVPVVEKTPPAERYANSGSKAAGKETSTSTSASNRSATKSKKPSWLKL